MWGCGSRGRERAENVIEAEPQREAIVRATAKARSAEFRESLRGMTNPYGEGRASQKIVEVLTTVPLTPELLIEKARL